MRRLSRTGLVGLALAGALSVAQTAGAQTGQIDPVPATKTVKSAHPAKHKPDNYQSPLATIMSSHLWTNVPEAQGFVRDSRPAPKDLKYTPLTSQLGPDPVRPKPRDAANVMALQAEMEASLSHNAGRGGVKVRKAKKSAAAE